MISVLIAALLQAAAPAASAGPGPSPDNGLPKDDYGLVAWCHGALAGQLELEPLARADMEKIEGKAKVAQHAKEDAELEKSRRQYLKDYEKALSAAEAASPTMIHAKGVAAEQAGYRMWAATRNKAPIWRMLDWGMWDPNDAGCGDAAKRLYDKASLFGQALKGSDAPAAETPAPEPVAQPVAEPVAQPVADATTAPAPSAEAAPAPAAALPAGAEPIGAHPAATPLKTAKTRTGVRAHRKSAEAVRAAIEAAPPAAAPAPAPASDETTAAAEPQPKPQ